MNQRIVDLASEICMAARKARVTKAVASCKCGKAVYRNGLCAGCHEDRFYGRDVPGAKIEGME